MVMFFSLSRLKSTIRIISAYGFSSARRGDLEQAQDAILNPSLTAAFLSTVEDSAINISTDNWNKILAAIQIRLLEDGHDRVLQLTSSRPVAADEPMFGSLLSSPSNAEVPQRRALVVAINYAKGPDESQPARHQEAVRICNFLQSQGFVKEKICMLMDDGFHNAPTKENILGSLNQLSQLTRTGDVVFVYMCGRGVYENKNGFLFSSDEQRISDDDLLTNLVKPMASRVKMTILIDASDVGSVLQLPYHYKFPQVDAPTFSDKDDTSTQESIPATTSLDRITQNETSSTDAGQELPYEEEVDEEDTQTLSEMNAPSKQGSAVVPPLQLKVHQNSAPARMDMQAVSIAGNEQKMPTRGRKNTATSAGRPHKLDNAELVESGHENYECTRRINMFLADSDKVLINTTKLVGTVTGLLLAGYGAYELVRGWVIDDE